MTPSVVLYTIAIALAILLAACVVLAYILAAQPAARPATPPPAAPPPQKQQAERAGSGGTGGSQKPQESAGAAAPPGAREPQITDVKVYVFTPEVLRRCGVGSAAWYYYFNITVEGFTARDPVYPIYFKALTPEGPRDLNYPSQPAIFECYFPSYNDSLNRTGVINVYAGLQSSVQLDITDIEYRGRRYSISDSNRFFVVCIGKRILLKTNNTILRPLHMPQWSLGLLPADRRYTIVVHLPRGRYEVRAPSGVAVEQQVVEGGGNVTVVLRFDNKPLAYDELVIEFRKAG
jgi:hypothetical protein